MIITRDDIRRYRAVTAAQGKILDKMLLSQPPALALEPMVWADRDETKEYLGQTTDLSDVRIENENGVTVGELHRKLGELFDQYQDVPAIKLTTVWWSGFAYGSPDREDPTTGLLCFFLVSSASTRLPVPTRTQGVL
jgi:hypothetical protein